MFKFSKPNESPGLLFWQASTLWKRQINNVLKQLDITHTQYVILAVIYFLKMDGQRTTQTAISEISMIDNMTISNSVRLLEKKKLIVREVDTIDSRAKVLNCTALGNEKLQKANSLVENVDDKFFDLSSDNVVRLMNLLTLLKDKNKDWRK